MSFFLLFLSSYLLEIVAPCAYLQTHGSSRKTTMKNQAISVAWISTFTPELARSVIDLVNCATIVGGTLGYSKPMSELQAQQFIESLEHRLSAGDAHVLLGRCGTEAVFFVIMGVNHLPNCRHRAELSKGVVRPDFRGRRLVELSLKEIVLRAEAIGVEQLVLDVREDSRAYVLWKRLGFVTYGVLEDYARANSGIYRGHFMVQTVDSLRKRFIPEVIHNPPPKETQHAQEPILV